MAFVFQQPGTTKLLGAINAAAGNADHGGGVFAFATTGGINALFACQNIAAMLAQHRPFQLIVGIDAITNAEALLCLHDKLRQSPKKLKVEIFFHEYPSSTFHPKFSWFCQGGDVRLVTGSGNLTKRGLGQASVDHQPPGNWEAFSVQSFSGADAAIVKQEIDNWLTAQRNAGTLCSLDDERVRAKAMANGRVRFATEPAKVLSAPVHGAPMPVVNAALADGVELGTPEVLVRELPKTRPGQGDVGQTAHQEFFGYEGVDKYIFMQHVALDNELNSVHPVWLFFNPASANYRLELHATAKQKYEIGENDERMILIATKLDNRSFRYTFLSPITEKGDYDQVNKLLDPIPPHPGKIRKMRQKFVSPEDLRNAWSEVPSNLLPVILPTSEP